MSASEKAPFAAAAASARAAAASSPAPPPAMAPAPARPAPVRAPPSAASSVAARAPASPASPVVLRERKMLELVSSAGETLRSPVRGSGDNPWLFDEDQRAEVAALAAALSALNMEKKLK